MVCLWIVPLLRLLVVASEGHFLQRPWLDESLHPVSCTFSSVLISWPFLILKAKRFVERFEVHKYIYICILFIFIIYTYYIIWLYSIHHFKIFLLPGLKSANQDYALHRPLRPKYELSDEEIWRCWRVWSLLVFIGYNPLLGSQYNCEKVIPMQNSGGTKCFCFSVCLTTGCAKASFSSRRPSKFRQNRSKFSKSPEGPLPFSCNLEKHH